MRFFTDSPVVASRDLPHEADALRSLRRRGALWSPLPGIYAHKDTEDGWELRVRAAHLWAPDAVVCGAAAAKLLWWQDLRCDEIELWCMAKRQQPAPWVRLRRSAIDAEHYTMWRQMKIAGPALSAVQLARDMGGNPIDEALRRGSATLPEMEAALGAIAKQPGTARVRKLLGQSKHEPWSELERRAHGMLEEAGITGWRGNYGIRVGDERFFVDIAFPGLKIAIEIDGFAFHKSRQAFDEDRRRQNLLVLAGWTVLRFTSSTLELLVEQLLVLMQ